MSKGMSKKNQMSLLRQCASLFATKKCCGEDNILEWIRIVFAAHRLGYLYVGFSDNGNIDMACIAYHIPLAKINEANRSDLPHKSYGEVLYCTAVASISEDKLKLHRLMKWYLKNNLEIKYMAYDYRNSERLKIFRIRRDKDGKIIQAKLPFTA